MRGNIRNLLRRKCLRRCLKGIECRSGYTIQCVHDSLSESTPLSENKFPLPGTTEDGFFFLRRHEAFVIMQKSLINLTNNERKGCCKNGGHSPCESK